MSATPTRSALSSGVIDEYRPLFRTNKFNICDDETFDLAKGRSKALAEAEGGERALYVRHVKALCEHIVAQGGIPDVLGAISCGASPKAAANCPRRRSA